MTPGANQSEQTCRLSRADRFAEYLSRGYSIPEIRQFMNLTNGAAQGLMTRIRKGLGEQAV